MQHTLSAVLTPLVLADENRGPLYPTSYDVIWTVVLVAGFALLVAALVSIGRRSRALGAGTTVLWVILVLAVPLLGAVAWFLAGRSTARTS